MLLQPALTYLGLGLTGATLLLIGGAAERYRSSRRASSELQHRVDLLNELPGAWLEIQAQAPWRIEAANQQAAVLLGRSASALMGAPLLSAVLAPTDSGGQRLVDAMLQGLNAQTLQSDATLRQGPSNGKDRWLEMKARLSPVSGANKSASILISLQDVTEWQLARQRIEVARSIIQGSRDAIVSKNLEGIVTSWNAGATEVFGYSEQEAIGMPITKLFLERDLHQEKVLMAHIQQGQIVPSFEATRVRRDGHKVHVSVTLSPIRDAAGNVVGASKIARDISEHKLNEALRKDVANAEHMAAGRTAFLARMSHELRTPMTAVLGFGEMLLQSGLNDEQRKQVQAIQSSSKHLLALLDDLLDTARLDKGELTLQVAPFSLQEMMAEVHAQFAPKANNKRISLIAGCVPDTPDLYEGDVHRIRQIVSNLVDNAIKFTPAGKVQAIASHDGKALILEVTDTGVGMSSEQLDQIFDPFVQAEGDLDRKHGGTGLGTTICQRLAKLMGGEIIVYSTPGQGSHFVVKLPLQMAPDAPQSPFAELNSSPSHSSTQTKVATSAPSNPWVDEAAALAIWGDISDMWPDALRLFEAELPVHMDRIRKAFQTEDSSVAMGAVHALRGAASTVALPTLFQRLDGMETLLRAGQLVDARDQLPLLEQEASQTQKQILRISNATALKKPASSAPAVNISEARSQLGLMRLELQASEIPMQTLKQLKQALAGHPPEDLWNALCTGLDAFEYDAALTALSALEQWVEELPAAKE